MRKLIAEFYGKDKFLDNFYEGAPFVYDGVRYLNSEAAFQAQKTKTKEERRQFSNLNPRDAKTLGRRVDLRADWEEIKDRIMYEVVLAKFTQNEDIKNKLLQTGDAQLVEGNNHGDTYWGITLHDHRGYNMLGYILEKVREDLGGWEREDKSRDGRLI